MKRIETENDEKNRELLGDLFEKGIIDEDGKIFQHDNQ